MSTLSDKDLQAVVEAATGKTAPPTKKGPKKPTVTTPEFDEATSGGEGETTKGKKYSDLFGWDAAVLGKQGAEGSKEDFVVEMYKDKEHVPELDENRIIDHEVMYPFVLSQQPQMNGMKVLMVGPTGSGKTTAVMHYCTMTKKGMYRINGRQDMESDTLIGRYIVTESGMEYLLGELPKALLRGDTVLIDEPWKIPSGIWMTLQRLMERGGVLQIDDMPDELEAKTIVPHKNARIVLADNVIGTGDNVEQYGATMIQDGSTLNRIDLVIKVPYLKQEQEEELIAAKFPLLVPKNSAGERGMQNVSRMVKMLNLLRQGYDTNELSSPASLRNVETWAEIACAVRSYEDSFKWTLLNRYADDSERAAVIAHYHTVYGRNL